MSSSTDDELHNPTKDKNSPLHGAYFSPDPKDYGLPLLDLNYTPKVNVLDSDCKVLLDAGASFGCTTLGCLFGWNFRRCTEFWSQSNPLTEEERADCLLKRPIKTIGMDVFPQPLEYGKNMHIYDEYVVQNFEEIPSSATLNALKEADTLIFQHCLTYIPKERFIEYITTFVGDRSVKKQLIYDMNPYFDDRAMDPDSCFMSIGNYTVVEDRFLYRDKTEEEQAKSQDTESRLFVKHYTVTFGST